MNHLESTLAALRSPQTLPAVEAELAARLRDTAEMFRVTRAAALTDARRLESELPTATDVAGAQSALGAAEVIRAKLVAVRTTIDTTKADLERSQAANGRAMTAIEAEAHVVDELVGLELRAAIALVRHEVHAMRRATPAIRGALLQAQRQIDELYSVLDRPVPLPSVRPVGRRMRTA